MAFANRWMGLLAVAAQRALAASLLELPIDECGADGDIFLRTLFVSFFLFTCSCSGDALKSYKKVREP